ncbi:hypothetical protein AZI87_13910 [Bdellovibrio bacteriovorus]|uniref:Flavodoxin-like fold domain-containing protein n=1 Tax=Bdellovibrio bacteriovorus TaxID=959 RepID=A0A161QFV2_BDEBC|nr:NAD(P)H-dependent oxidoreductase [Bdellovibrio bacteriovorus]KYG64375.1 hypothetical protein AZI87_13910 [Bdellovibrio bacteriovorus]
MKKALVLFAHPFSKQSRVNRAIMDQLRELKHVRVHDLYEEYPYFHIQVQKEQELLLEHDLVVWQHPFYWFSMPPLMKLWCDEVLRRGFAYGPEGNKLHGKDFFLSITTGGWGDPSSPGSVEDFFPPYRQTIEQCGMKWHKPVVMTGTGRATEEQILLHAEAVRRRMIDYCATGVCKDI